jgi:aminoglycoside phosphotransferase (APT) family kinase protein
VRAVPEWRGALDSHPRTLIHNDFNPRNIALRRDAGRLRLVAYDWELATVGVPQRDLAEFLCFVLPEDVSLARVTAAVDAHRGQLERLSGTPLDAGRWRAGFMDALSEVLVARLAFYALIDHVRPQPFLPRVVRTWLRLHTLSSRWSG